jgi:hypothetical protein
VGRLHRLHWIANSQLFCSIPTHSGESAQKASGTMPGPCVSPGTFKWNPNYRCEEVETQGPLFEADQPNGSPDADRPANVPALCVADLQPFDDEMRVRDIRLAETAQMGQPRDIRHGDEIGAE